MRFFDIIFSIFGLLVLLTLIATVFLPKFLRGDLFFHQSRVGRFGSKFVILKFRTLPKNVAPDIPSHLVDANNITRFGRILRRTKLDELPQLWNVLKGEMSLVGPRPCLPNQHELIFHRENKGIFVVRPGITGLAQISGIDMSTPLLLAQTDLKMIKKLNLGNYLLYLTLTVLGRGYGDKALKS